MNEDEQKGAERPLTRQQRRALERAGQKQAAEDAKAAESVEQIQARQKEAIDQEFARMAAHPAVEAEHHEGAGFLNMQAIDRLQNAAAALTNQKTGRHFLISFPIDLTDAELFEVVGWLSGAMRTELERRRAAGEDKPKTTLHIARSLPPREPVIQ